MKVEGSEIVEGYRSLVRLMIEARQRGMAETLAYVVMPDHLHWLLALGETQSLSRLVGGIKSAYAHHAGRRIWQHGYHDHAVRREEDLLHLARYVVANPLRAGLVRKLGDYPHWDAIWL